MGDGGGREEETEGWKRRDDIVIQPLLSLLQVCMFVL